MDRAIAEQIAALLNRRNQLQKELTWADIREHASEYRIIAREGKVAGCIQIRHVQWYQAELLHLVVDERFEGQRFAIRLGEMAETFAREEGARILQATVRETNDRMVDGLKYFGWTIVNRFRNRKTDNTVLIFQKVLS